MAKLSSAIDVLHSINVGQQDIRALLAQMIKQDQDQEDQKKRDEIAKDEGDKKKKSGGFIGKSLGKTSSKIKKMGGGIFDEFVQNFGAIAGLAAIDWLSNPENIKMIEESFDGMVTFFKDTFESVKGFLDQIEKDGWIKTIKDIMGEEGTLAVAKASLVALAALAAPFLLLKAAVGTAAAALAGMIAAAKAISKIGSKTTKTTFKPADYDEKKRKFLEQERAREAEAKRAADAEAKRAKENQRKLLQQQEAANSKAQADAEAKRVASEEAKARSRRAEIKAKFLEQERARAAEAKRAREAEARAKAEAKAKADAAAKAKAEAEAKANAKRIREAAAKKRNTAAKAQFLEEERARAAEDKNKAKPAKKQVSPVPDPPPKPKDVPGARLFKGLKAAGSATLGIAGALPFSVLSTHRDETMNNAGMSPASKIPTDIVGMPLQMVDLATSFGDWALGTDWMSTNLDGEYKKVVAGILQDSNEAVRKAEADRENFKANNDINVLGQREYTRILREKNAAVEDAKRLKKAAGSGMTSQAAKVTGNKISQQILTPKTNENPVDILKDIRDLQMESKEKSDGGGVRFAAAMNNYKTEVAMQPMTTKTPNNK